MPAQPSSSAPFRLLRACAAATCLLTSFIARPAAAQADYIQEAAPPKPEPTAADMAEADRLFDLGRKQMMEPGKLELSCETLGMSLALVERGDTYLNLAECHRRQGKTATAWREFGRALEHAKTVEFKEAIETAKGIRADLEAKLSTLTVNVPKAMSDLSSFTVELNGVALRVGEWGTAMVLDPQTYAITAHARGYQPWTKSVELQDDKDVKEVTVTLTPVSAAVPSPKEAPTPPPKPAPVASSGGGVHPLTIIGFAVAGVGFVGYGVLGGLSIDKRSQFDEECPDNLCPAGSEDDIDTAILFADLATVGLVTGIVGASAGLVGLLFLGGDDEGETALQLNVGPGSMSVSGRF